MSIYGYPDNLTDEQIATAYNSATEAWKPVPSHTFLAWLGGGGRFSKLSAFVDDATKAQPVRDAVRVALLAANNPNAYLSLDPESEHSALLNYLIGYSVLSAEDADALIAKAQAREPITAEDVATERTRLTAQAAKDTLSNWLASRTSVAQAAIHAGTATSEAELKAILSA